MSWSGWAGAGLGVAGAAILARMALARTPGATPPPFEEFRARWRHAHLVPPGHDPGGRVLVAYLRLPYRLGAPLARAGVDPNLLTLLALWLAVVAGWTATLGPGWAALAGALTLAAGLADGVDGAVAVLGGRAGGFGFVWDSTADRLADLALVAGPMLLGASRAEGSWAVAAVASGTACAVLGFLLEYVRARAQAAGPGAVGTVVTPGERPTRVIVLSLTGMAVGLAQVGGGGIARGALLAGYPAAFLTLAGLEAVGCWQLLVALARASEQRG